MKNFYVVFSQTCGACNSSISINCDEPDCTPAFCPFCGKELSVVKKNNEMAGPGTGNLGSGNFGTGSTGVAEFKP